jgi:hypothetical protein
MSDPNAPDNLDAKHEQNRQQRIKAVKQWVEYIKSEPAEKWGAQQNTIVNDQLEAAQSVQTSAAHQQHVKAVAEEIREAGDDSEEDPDSSC